MGISWRSVVGFFSAISSCCKQPSGSTSTPKSSDPVPSGSQQNVVVGDSTELPKITEPSQLNRFIEYIEDLLAALKKKPSDQTAAATSNVGAEFGGHLKCAADMMERVSSEAEKFKDSKGDLIPEEARKIVTDALKGLGNLHWIGVAFSIVAYLLENVHRISSNSEECIELLEKIIDVAKVLRELGEKTCDDQTQEALMKAVQTIVDGAIICCYYMQERPLFKYLTAQTVEGSLRNIRDKLHDLKSDLTLMVGRLNLMATEQIQKQLPQRSEQRRNILQISDPVGLEEPFEKVKHLLNMESNEVAKAVIIYGFGGSGKTTLAEYVVSNLPLNDFQLCVVRLDELNPNIKKLQEQILSDVGRKKIDFRDSSEGRLSLKDALKDELCFLLIDNVVDKNQVSELLPQELRISPRSRILITSRKSDVKEALPRNLKCEEYGVQTLPHERSVELLQKIVLNNLQHVTSQDEVKIKDLAEACGGVPLLLSVIGGHLRVDWSESAYEEALRSLKEGEQGRYVEEGLSHKLLYVYHRMKNENAKDAFVDICTWFHGWGKRRVSSIVGEDELKLLQEGALVNITESNIVIVHDVLRSFGIKEGRTTRLHGTADELLSALTDEEGQKALAMGKIKGLRVSGGFLPDTEILNKLGKSLRVLNLGDGISLASRCQGRLFKNLRLLKVGKDTAFPFTDASKLEKLAVFYCKSQQVLQLELDGLPRTLKQLELESNLDGPVHPSWWRHINNLTNLQKLTLQGLDIVEFPEQFAFPATLRKLELNYCTGLKELPRGFGQLDFLTDLTLLCCSQLKRLSSDLECPASLKYLNIVFCSQLEGETMEKIVKLKNLVKIEITCSYNLVDKWDKMRIQNNYPFTVVDLIGAYRHVPMRYILAATYNRSAKPGTLDDHDDDN